MHPVFSYQVGIVLLVVLMFVQRLTSRAAYQALDDEQRDIVAKQLGNRIVLALLPPGVFAVALVYALKRQALDPTTLVSIYVFLTVLWTAQFTSWTMAQLRTQGIPGRFRGMFAASRACQAGMFIILGLVMMGADLSRL